ncbi:CD3072 family TudS-related putative desulfidase [[Eubacterium] cellulosolvens]
MIEDKRSRKVVICSHCILNQNAKLEGIASWPGMVDPVVEVISKNRAGIIQMPCPEILYEGIRRFDKSIEQYRCAAFSELCERIARQTVEQVENYLNNGYRVPAILAIDGSPSCGYNLTQSAPEWRGLVSGRNIEPPGRVPGKGIYMEILERRLVEADKQVPFLGIPEVPEIGSLDSALSELEALLR